MFSQADHHRGGQVAEHVERTLAGLWSGGGMDTGATTITD